MSRLITSAEGGIRTPDGLIAHTGFRVRCVLAAGTQSPQSLPSTTPDPWHVTTADECRNRPIKRHPGRLLLPRLGGEAAGGSHGRFVAALCRPTHQCR